jgi:hypothetical protein
MKPRPRRCDGASRVLCTEVWAVQGFNMYNLRNTGISADDLLHSLANGTGRSGSSRALLAGDAAAAVLGGASATTSSEWLVSRLFRGVQLVPIRRPHTSDEVVAHG